MVAKILTQPTTMKKLPTALITEMSTNVFMFLSLVSIFLSMEVNFVIEGKNNATFLRTGIAEVF